MAFSATAAAELEAQLSVSAVRKFEQSQYEEFRHGEIYMEETGVVCKFLVVPEALVDPAPVYKLMLNHWGLRLPNLIIMPDCIGSSHYCAWLGAEHGLDPASWGGTDEVTEALRTKFVARMDEVTASIMKAASESNSWFLGAVRGDNHCLIGGMKAADDTTRSKLVVFDGFGLEGWWAKDTIMKVAVPLSDKPMQRMNYPSLAHLFPTPARPEPQLPEGTELNKRTHNSFLLPCCTHVIFQHERTFTGCAGEIHSRPFFGQVPMGNMMFFGFPTALQANSWPMQRAKRGDTMILLRNTGFWINQMCEAVDARKHQKALGASSQDEGPALPETVSARSFIIVDVRDDPLDKIVSSVMGALSSTVDEESQELGAARDEEQRLSSAWDTVVLYRANAGRYQRVSSVLQGLQILIAVCVTLFSLAHTSLELQAEGGKGRASEDTALASETCELLESRLHVTCATASWGLHMAVVVLPLCTGLVLSLQSKFNFRGKYDALSVAEASTISVVYKYRARAGEYSPQSSAMLTRLYAMLPAGPAVPESAKTTEVKKHDQPGQQPDENAQEDTALQGRRRKMFSKQMGAVQSELTAIFELDALRPPKDWQHARKQVFSQLFPGEFKRSLVDAESNAEPSRKEDSRYAPLVALEFAPENDAHLCEEDREFDDGMSPLTAEEYASFRLLPLVQHLQRKVQRLQNMYSVLQFAVFLCVGLAAGFATFELQLWVPAVVSVSTALTGVVDFYKIPVQLQATNKALRCLRELRTWWQSLSAVERRLMKNKDKLVTTTETAALAALGAWSGASADKGVEAEAGEEEEGHKDQKQKAKKSPSKGE